jgi:hypothetical protein
MLIGWVIEVMILRETIFATQMELYLDKDRWQEVKDFYIAKAELKVFIAELENGTPQKTLSLPVENAEIKELEPEKEKSSLDDPGISFLKELNDHLRGKDNRPSLPAEKGE